MSFRSLRKSFATSLPLRALCVPWLRKTSCPFVFNVGELNVEWLKLKAPDSSFFASFPLDSDLESFFLDLRSLRPGRALFVKSVVQRSAFVVRFPNS